jgi:methionyl-tRNA formyltransferase
MRVVFFGSPASALPSLSRLLEDGHRVELVVTQPDRPAGRGRALSPSAVKRFARERGLALFQPERVRKDPRSLELLQSVRPDIGVVVAFGQILPREVIDLPRWHTINVHFSLLPKYRGAAPVAWAILRGESRTGVTVFELNERMDEGDILSRREVEILPRENAGELETRLAGLGAELLSETLARRDSLELVPQDHGAATYAPKLDKEEGRLEWHKPAAAIDRQVRAFSPRPSAFTFLAGRRLQVSRGRPVAEPAGKASFGEIAAVGAEGLRVCCAEGTVYLVERVKPENRKEMAASDFGRGARLEAGARFE